MEFTRLHIAGAFLSNADCIYFEVLKKISDQYHMLVTISQDHDEEYFLFPWDMIPQNIMNIYEYINSKSSLDQDNVLTGCHMSRKGDDVYEVAKYPKNAIGNDVKIMDSQISMYDEERFREIWITLKSVKNL